MSSSTGVPLPRPARALALRTSLHPYACRLFAAAGRQPFDRRRLIAARNVAVHRQAKGDPRPLARPTRNLDAAAVQRQQPLDDGQAETRAGMAAIVARPRLEERVADLRQIFRIDTNPVVL